jgi:uncharacterized C2H2 Zn-finger protein
MEPDGVGGVKCEHCGEAFESIEQRKTHVKKYHQNFPTTAVEIRGVEYIVMTRRADDDKFVCPICAARLGPDPSSWRRHVRGSCKDRYGARVTRACMPVCLCMMC